MSQDKLPYKDFKWLPKRETTNFVIMQIDDDADKGFLYSVTLNTIKISINSIRTSYSVQKTSQ